MIHHNVYMPAILNIRETVKVCRSNIDLSIFIFKFILKTIVMLPTVTLVKIILIFYSSSNLCLPVFKL